VDLVIFCPTAFDQMLCISWKMVQFKVTCFLRVVDEGIQHGLKNGRTKKYTEGSRKK
jgi:hypothetical protein